MSDKLIEQLKEAKSHVHLSADRKAAIRANLIEMIDGRVRATAALGERAARPNIFLAAFSASNRMRAVTAVVVVLAMSGAGVSLAAEDARPGDALYPIKVDVNENIQAALAFSTKAKAQVAVVHAERRLEEAASLSAEGKLDAETEAELQEDFEEHAGRAEGHIRKLRGEGNVQGVTDVAVRFEGVLRAQEAVLATLGRTHRDVAALSLGTSADLAAPETSIVVDERDGGGKKIGQSVRGRLQALTNLRAHLESDVEEVNAKKEEIAAKEKEQAEDQSVQTEVFVQAQVAAAAKAAAGAEDFLRAESRIEGSVSAVAEARVAAAVKLSAEAEEKLDAGQHSAAFALANSAIRAAAEARVLVGAEDRLEGKMFFFEDEDGEVKGSSKQKEARGDGENDEERVSVPNKQPTLLGI